MQLDLSLHSISVSSLVLPSLGTHSALLLLLSTLAYSMVQFLGYIIICVSHMPSLKAKKLGKLAQEKVLLEL